MGKFDQDTEDRMLAALQAMRERDNYGFNQAAREFNVKSMTLRRRHKGFGSVRNNGGRNKALNAEQLKALASFIDRQISLGIPATKEMVVSAAQRILQVNGSNHELGRAWYARWLKANPQYKIQPRMGPKAAAPDIFDHLETLIKNQSSVEASIDDVLVQMGCPIVSVGILDAGEISSRVLGSPRSANVDLRVKGSTKPYNQETLFQACSISKPTTALAVLKMAQEGKLDLDASISEYLDREKLAYISTSQTQALVSKITLRMLLCHTSGLSVPGFGGYNKPNIPSVAQILTGTYPANNAPVKLLRMPGQAYSYSGGGYTVIQLILETLMEKPFYQIMDELVLQPLNMTRSTFQVLSAIEKNYAPAYLTGQTPCDPDHHILPECAAAGLWTTPTDLLRVVQSLQWSLEADDFLEKHWAETMLREDRVSGRGLGWVAKQGGIAFSHAGSNDPGYRCHVVGYADLSKIDSTAEGSEESRGEDDASGDGGDDCKVPTDCGICIMTSSQLGNHIMEKILAAIPYLKDWPAIPPSSGISPAIIPFMDRTKVICEVADDWCGVWEPGPWILSDKEGMHLSYSDYPRVKLISAAIAPIQFDEGDSIDLIPEGLEMMLRLVWKDGARSIELWQNGAVTMLQRSDERR
ncbi:hypothetical protein BP6252_06069 [Coleophoma cylindrospora]|uniref:HTH CENPB-type domain-containing protein n=1 Tax=Coleophoma cylindrospora TaxID=1849047 RepID=A0A3D8RLJ3_9HELO|nr:hypothetical protein BP6252_06069 [Coleophoma cylindrospora]